MMVSMQTIIWTADLVESPKGSLARTLHSRRQRPSEARWTRHDRHQGAHEGRQASGVGSFGNVELRGIVPKESR